MRACMPPPPRLLFARRCPWRPHVGALDASTAIAALPPPTVGPRSPLRGEQSPGALYESLVQATLCRVLDFRLAKRTLDGRGDGGVDLVGTWWQCRVGVQCKRKMDPRSAAVEVSVVRELESSLLQWTRETQSGHDVCLGLLASNVRLSRIAKRWFMASSSALAHARVDDANGLFAFEFNLKATQTLPGGAVAAARVQGGGMVMMDDKVVVF
jgi:hypothetical protein